MKSIFTARELHHTGRMIRQSIVACLLVLAATPAFPQETVLLDQIAGLVDRGKLNVEVDLQPGRAEAGGGWSVRVVGTPAATLVAEAEGGRVRRLVVAVTRGELVIEGAGLRPRLSLEAVRFEEGKGIVEARFRGRGVWRPIVALFRPLVRPVLRHLDIPTDISSILRGQILATGNSATPSGAGFLDLVREVHIGESEFIAFGGHPLTFEMVELQTAAHPSSGAPLRAAIDKGTFRPAAGNRPARFEVDGRIDGEIENGAVSFVGSRCTFSRGSLKKGAYRVYSGKDGQIETSFSAGTLAVELTSGQFHWPGGPKVAVEAPSHFDVRDLRVRAGGSYSGIVDASLFGKVGAIERAGTLVSADDIELRTHGATIADGKATGDVNLAFRYRLDHTLVVHYPVEQLGDRHVPLQFHGAFAADLHFQDAGSGDEGVVNGKYRFTVPWAPIERAAFEVLSARWSQDVTKAIRKVDFVIEPRHFGPCGGNCFLLDLVVTAEKAKKKGYLFQQICNTEGQADLVVDAPSRSILLRNVRVEPRCHGAIGAVLNLVTPLLTRTYSDVTLLQMPRDLPFSIDSVGSDAGAVVIGGNVAWSAGIPPATAGR